MISWKGLPLVLAAIVQSGYGQDIPTTDLAPAKWVHPGAMISQSQLDFVISKVNKREQPWADAYDALMDDEFVSNPQAPSPHVIVECGPYSDPDVGCKAERDDSLAAYANALAWAINGTEAYARQAIRIMDAYSSTIQGHNNSNAPLQSGWVGSVWARAGEIIRYTNAGWSDDGIQQFGDMLRKVYMPLTVNGTAKNVANWELVMTEAAIMMAVFLEDPDSYNTAMGWFLKRIPATVYLKSDGEYPVAARGQSSSPDAIIAWWFNQTTFQEDGQAQETCRDMEHTGYSFASMAHVAETSRIQGTDLYETDLGTRLRAALEFHSQFDNGKEPESWLCGGKLNLHLGNITEVGFNALSFRMGLDMPETENLTERQRPARQNGLFTAYETLTHAQNDA
ncbi:chondroitin AC/alginate lyase [Aspergillus pseudonomiae]|uniref:Chondroitin AC/alginate lyase n=1 Tax=Aspergillus pseudonomiae TaxID=1506151 RepID=A0A5N6HKI7_9EURO|nr:chondroitin AC/alginate lyase [Aspergillus pseudonomiae]KAB8255031.1 chondroitin AC/alginate lyase [Aspergillus pseudonomiae]KAE8398469.1 chondroitin AC/alginate lyase [Aspergillus pseudonomiae]